MALINPTLVQFCEQTTQLFDQIPTDRKVKLQGLANYVQQKKEHAISVNVICTHNSRRSHIGQLVLKLGAYYYGIDHFQSFSGGTEATAFNPNAVAALKRIGFDITTHIAGPNPRYEVSFGTDLPKELLFSKVFNDDTNPTRDFAAVMVCSEADEACPFVPGAAARFSLPFNDPKAFDGKPEETEKYDEAVQLIGRDFLWVMSQV